MDNTTGLLFQPLTLEGKRINLVPLSIDHLDALTSIGLDEDLWQWTNSSVRSREEMAKYIEEALEQQRRGTGLPFVSMAKSEHGFEVTGSTRFFNIEPAHKRLEIGHTWIAPKWQRTFVNTEAKYLMLRYAFETMGCNRVEFKTDALNTASRNAIKRLGATEEGILLSHMVTANSRIRDSVYYSIIRGEWESIKRELEKKINRA